MRLTTLIPLPLLASLLLAAPALATPGGEGGNSNCQGVGNPNSPCQPSDNDGGSQPNGNSGSDTNANNNNNQNSNINENNIANKNNNVKATNSASRSGASSNSSSHVSGLNATATGGTSTSTSSSHSYYERDTPVAPLLNRADSATMEGVTVPLPTIGISGFYSSGDNSWNNDNRDDVGVTLGLRLPLGGGQFREAALRREKFQIVKEAIYLKEKGVLTYEAFPEHYVALYGAALSPTDAVSSN